MKKLGVIMMCFLAAILAGCNRSANAEAKPRWSEIPFFAMDTGTKDENHQTAESQVVMHKELGYDGIGYWRDSGGLAEVLRQLDIHGLHAFPVYKRVSLDKDTTACPAEIEQAIQLLKGRIFIMGHYNAGNG